MESNQALATAPDELMGSTSGAEHRPAHEEISSAPPWRYITNPKVNRMQTSSPINNLSIILRCFSSEVPGGPMWRVASSWKRIAESENDEGQKEGGEVIGHSYQGRPPMSVPWAREKKIARSKAQGTRSVGLI
ncbi:hypothetical protein ACJZ2D_014008 [Fusarium nematophilum]